MKFWIMADPHLGHDLMKQADTCNRPGNFEDQILRSVSKLEPTDVFICLGDVCFGNEAMWHDKFTAAVSCKKWLVLGNHDKNSMTWYLSHGWDFVGNMMTMELFGHHIMFSHVPQPESRGYTVNIHGHFHNNSPHRHEPELVAIKNGKQVLLSPEWLGYKPISLEWIIGKFNQHDKRKPLEFRPEEKSND